MTGVTARIFPAAACTPGADESEGEAAAEERLQSARKAVESADERATLALNMASDAAQAVTGLQAESDRAPQGALFAAQQAAEARRGEALEAGAALQAAQTAAAYASEERSRALAELAAARDAAATLGKVKITAEQQYFNMVASALQRVEAAAAGRLAKRGSYKPEDVVTLIEGLAKKAEDAAKAAEKDRKANLGAGTAALAGADRAVAVMTQIDLELAALQPKLDKCLVHASG